jgi:hypothetical protein
MRSDISDMAGDADRRRNEPGRASQHRPGGIEAMPSAPSASWVVECAACRHSNPARAHFCSVCGAPLQSPAAAATAATRAAGSGMPGMAAAAASPEAAADVPEPKGFMLHFNDDNTLAIAPRYTSPDAGEAETAGALPPGAAATADDEATSTIHAAAARHGGAEFRFSLPAPQAQEPRPAAASRLSFTLNGTTVAVAMLTLTALVGTASYLLGRSSAPAYDTARAPVQPATATAAPALQPAVAQPLGTVPVAPAQPAQGGAPSVADSLDQAQRALAWSDAAAAGRAAVAAPVTPALPARQTAQATPATRAAPAAAVAPAAPARAPTPATPCNATVAALGLCEP